MLFSSKLPAGGEQTTHENVYLAGSLVATIDHAWPSNAIIATKYQHTDALGSPVAVTNEAGAVIERTNFDPYGGAIGKVVDGLGYTGHVMDPLTGLTYMQQRYYDQGVGRFLSVDPVTASSVNGGNFNRYWYANNNPYYFADPDGRASRSVFKSFCESVGICLRDKKEVDSKNSEKNDAGQGVEHDPMADYESERRDFLRRGAETFPAAGKTAAKTVASMAGGAILGRILGRVSNWLGYGRRHVSFSTKIETQMGKRGWDRDSVSDAVSNPMRTVLTRDTRNISGGGVMNDPATAYYSRNGGYVVRNDLTGDVVQVSNRNDAGWRAPWD